VLNRSITTLGNVFYRFGIIRVRKRDKFWSNPQD